MLSFHFVGEELFACFPDQELNKCTEITQPITDTGKTEAMSLGLKM